MFDRPNQNRPQKHSDRYRRIFSKIDNRNVVVKKKSAFSAANSKSAWISGAGAGASVATSASLLMMKGRSSRVNTFIASGASRL